MEQTKKNSLLRHKVLSQYLENNTSEIFTFVLKEQKQMKYAN